MQSEATELTNENTVRCFGFFLCFFFWRRLLLCVFLLLRQLQDTGITKRFKRIIDWNSFVILVLRYHGFCTNWAGVWNPTTSCKCPRMDARPNEMTSNCGIFLGPPTHYTKRLIIMNYHLYGDSRYSVECLWLHYNHLNARGEYCAAYKRLKWLKCHQNNAFSKDVYKPSL